MEPFPHLSKAPILEAVIELRVATERPADVAAFDGALMALQSDFPIKQQIRHLTSTVAFDAEGKAEQQASSTPVGVRVETADHVQVVQMRPDLLAVSRVREYSKWSDLLAQTQRAWHLFAKAVAPKAVHRLGVRFINRIEIRDGVDLEHLLTAGPRIPPNLPQSIAGFSTRIVVPMEECAVMIAQAVELAAAGVNAAPPALVLDIDAFTDASLPAEWDAIQAKLATLRLVKNMAFFSSLTPEVIERFK